jgi:hypothetical protein
LLAAIDRVDRALRTVGGIGSAGLDLDEDEGATVECDDVELAIAGAGVALEGLPVGCCETSGDEILRQTPESLSLNGH